MGGSRETCFRHSLIVESKGWNDGATQSCAHWLNWKCGIDMGAAREKVRALTRVACPNTENTLLQYALHGTAAHVQRIVRDFRRCKEAEELGREAQQQARRKLTWFFDSDGMLNIKARLPAEAGRMFIQAIEAAKKELSAAETSAETPNVKFIPGPISQTWHGRHNERRSPAALSIASAA